MLNSWKPLAATLAVVLWSLSGCGGSDAPAPKDGAEETHEHPEGEEHSDDEEHSHLDGPSHGGRANSVVVHDPNDPLHPIVVLNTSQGEIRIKLNADKAPQTVKNFLAYVEKGYYDQTTFHQVISGYMVQAGGYTAKNEPKPEGQPIQNEAGNGLKNIRGSVAMARDPGDAHSATCEFFINVADNAYLDHQGKQPNT
ncbi:MAG: peptidylprolyl isomerase, partial [Planctomycetales bacterium]